MKKWKIWISAARPQTLAAAFVPVVTGASLAWTHSSFHFTASAVALFCAIFIQIGTNYANDYFDYKKGADTDDRLGFIRATSAGLIKPESMLNAALITMGIAFISGLYLVWIGGWVIFWIGVFSIIFGILYTGGPFPLGYNGLGDIFVFLFFGLIAVTGTYYINALGWSFEAVLLSIPVGALCVNILVVNNLRDINQDRITGKKTLGVLFGEFVLKAEYTGMILIAYSSLFVLFIYFEYTRAIFLPLLVFPIVLWQLRTVWGHDDKTVLNHTLERTAQFMVFFGILLSVSVLLQSA
jgi:1,4-dihydroxy-2-naphthoate polyprenyltransferase